jgi:hypothetical protein
LEHLFGGWETYQACFCVHCQCRSKTFLDGSKWNVLFLRLPSE